MNLLLISLLSLIPLANQQATKPLAIVTIHGVFLTWVAPGNCNGCTYNVARGTKTGGPYTTVASGLATTSYQDKAVTTGKYFYVTQAVRNSQQSGNSNEVQVAIP